MMTWMKSMLVAVTMVTLGAGAANAAPRSEPIARGHIPAHEIHDRDYDHDRGERTVREWRNGRYVTVVEHVGVVRYETPYDLQQRAIGERSEANRLRGEARWDRMFLIAVPADNLMREARDLDARAAADDAQARMLIAEWER